MFYTLAEATTLITLAITLAASVALSFILRKKPQGDVRIDDTPSTLTVRGSWTNVVIGVRLVAPVFAWRGDRIIRQESQGGGKGGGGGGGSVSVYYETGVHILATGPVRRLLRIEDNGEVIFDRVITSIDTPSGTELQTSKGDRFVIYWGEEDQPINTFLGHADRLGVASRWPFFCYVVWIEKRLGEYSGRWGQTQYVIDGGGVGTLLNRSSSEMAVWNQQAQDSGPNPAHVAYRVMTGTDFHGGGIDPSNIDTDSFEGLGAMLQREHSPCSVIAKDGVTVADVLADLSDEHGFMLSQVGDKLVAMPVREQSAVPTFDEGHLVDDPPTIVTLQTRGRPSRIAYLVPDRTQRFKPVDPLVVVNDAMARRTEGQVTSTRELQTVVDVATGVRVSRRLASQALVSTSVSRFKLNRDARALVPGQPFSIDGYGRFLCTAISISTDSPTVQVTCVPDQFNNQIVYDPGIQNVLPIPEAPVPDLYVRVIEMPRRYGGDEVTLGVLRIRGNQVTGASTVWVSGDGVTFQQVSSQPRYAVGGLLRRSIAYDAGTNILEGDAAPLFYPANVDVAGAAQDLTSDLSGWLSGRQVALVDDELFFVRSVEVDGVNFRLDGAIRAKFGSLRAAHLPGTPLFLFRFEDISVIRTPLAVPGATVWVKVQPQGVALDSVRAVRIRVVGFARAPLPPANLGKSWYTPGTTCALTWSPRVQDGRGRAAGEQAYGQPVAGTNVTGIGGDYLVVVRTADFSRIVNQFTVTSPAFNYTLSQRTADHGTANPTFWVQVIARDGVFWSNPESLLIKPRS